MEHLNARALLQPRLSTLNEALMAMSDCGRGEGVAIAVDIARLDLPSVSGRKMARHLHQCCGPK